MVSRPTYIGGLGFGMKWDMGWMHDALRYHKLDPIYRRYHHSDLNFRGVYMFSENYMLPLSHDEVVHLKGSLLTRMPGDDSSRFANLRLLLTNQWMQPGKKLLFMGGEIGQWAEWNHDSSIDWHLLSHHPHRGIQKLVADLNSLYGKLPALYAGDCSPAGFEWVDANDGENSTLSFLRKGPTPADIALVVFNCTPVTRTNFRVGIPGFDRWLEVLNTDATDYGGSGVGNYGAVDATPMPHRQFPRSLTLCLPPLAALVLVPEAPPRRGSSLDA